VEAPAPAKVEAAPAKAAKKDTKADAPAKTAAKKAAGEGKSPVEQAAAFKEKAGRSFQNRHWAEARDAYNQAIDLNPTDHTLYSNRSATFIEMGNFAKALEDAEKTIELKADWARGYFRKGTALEGLLRYPEATQAFAAGCKVDPKDAALTAVYNNRFVIH
jgi:tetratricopeptide (TPR) repeat protein